MSGYYDSNFRRYVPVSERRRKAAKKIARLKKTGREVSPVEIAGRKIAETFWGVAWCKNLEAYSDYSNRLPRGRTYVRNGSVIDLQIEAGHVRALVSGSEIYQVDIEIKRLVKRRWTGIKGHCAGQIDSLVELLQGAISQSVMEIVSRKGTGLFPSPREISLDCSCPDWATMCKHVAATLYGVGARLDLKPELLFALRGVDPAELVEAAMDRPATASRSRRLRRLRTGRVLASDELSSVFGVDIVSDVDRIEASSKDVGAPRKPQRSGAQRRKQAALGTSGKTRGKPVASKAAASRSPKKSSKRSTQKAAAKKSATKKASVGKATRKKTPAKKRPPRPAGRK